MTKMPAAVSCTQHLAMFITSSALSIAALTVPADSAFAQADEKGNEVVAFDEILVTGLRSRSTATKLDVEARDLPQALTFVPREVLDDLVITRIEDIAYTTVGVQPVQAYLGGQSLGFFLRGYNGSALLINGYNAGVTAGFTGSSIEIATVDRVEVLRGPASVLYGQGNPGGIVNVTTKKPLPDFGFAAEVNLSTDELRRGTADVTGPITDGIAYRFVGVLEDSGSFRDFVENKRIVAAPSLTLEPVGSLTIDLDYVYDRFTFTADRQGGSSPEIFDVIDVEKNLAEPWLPNTTLQAHVMRAQAEYRLSDDWKLRAAAFRFKSKFVDGADEIGFLAVNDDGLVERYYTVATGADDNSQYDRTLSGQLLGSVDTGPLNHSLILSYDNVNSYYNFYFVDGLVHPIDPRNPVYSDGPVAPPTIFFGEGAGFSKYDSVYAQDLISLGDKWKLLLGLRWDNITTGFYNDADRTDLSDEQVFKEWTPRAGVIYRPVEASTLYVSWGKSFLPNFGQSRLGELFAPEEGEAFEVGLKQEFLDSALALTIAAFQIDKSNILVIDPVNNNFNITAGSARSKGVEVELDGRIKPNWRARAGIAYTDATVRESLDPDFFPVGDRLPGAAKWMANFNSRYDVEDGPLAGLAVGGNIAYSSSREWVLPNEGPLLGSYVRVDAFASYDFGKFEAQVNVENMLDERILVANGFGLVGFDNPRRFLLTLRASFGALD